MTMKTKDAQLEANLEYLKLPFIRENYPSVAKKAAADQIGHLDFLSMLVEGETCQRQENAFKARLRRARLPYTKYLGDFQWSHPDKINRQQIENIFRLGFIDRKENVIFLGSCGMGKTHLATALAAAACEKGYSTLFTGAAEMLNKLAAAMAENDIETAIKKYARPQISEHCIF